MCLHVAAVIIPFNLICNMAMFCGIVLDCIDSWSLSSSLLLFFLNAKTNYCDFPFSSPEAKAQGELL